MISSARLLGVLVIINNGTVRLWTVEEHVLLLVLGGWQAQSAGVEEGYHSAASLVLLEITNLFIPPRMVFSL